MQLLFVYLDIIQQIKDLAFVRVVKNVCLLNADWLYYDKKEAAHWENIPQVMDSSSQSS